MNSELALTEVWEVRKGESIAGSSVNRLSWGEKLPKERGGRYIKKITEALAIRRGKSPTYYRVLIPLQASYRGENSSSSSLPHIHFSP